MNTAAMGRERLPVAITVDSFKPAEAALRVMADGHFAGQMAAVEIDGEAVGSIKFGLPTESRKIKNLRKILQKSR